MSICVGRVINKLSQNQWTSFSYCKLIEDTSQLQTRLAKLWLRFFIKTSLPLLLLPTETHEGREKLTEQAA
jgi:hypothetical protein